MQRESPLGLHVRQLNNALPECAGQMQREMQRMQCPLRNLLPQRISAAVAQDLHLPGDSGRQWQFFAQFGSQSQLRDSIAAASCCSGMPPRL